jgi:hypothetical protein
MTQTDARARRPASVTSRGVPAASEAELAQTLLSLAKARREGASFCPSEAARALAPADWRPLMPEIRRVAARLQRDGLLNVTQAGRPVDALSARGPIRLSRPMH